MSAGKKKLAAKHKARSALRDTNLDLFRATDATAKLFITDIGTATRGRSPTSDRDMWFAGRVRHSWEPSTGAHSVRLHMATFDGRDPAATKVKNILDNEVDTGLLKAVIKTLCDVVLSLLDAREFMAYQLSYANGCMAQERYDEIVSRFLGDYRYMSDQTLASKCAVLYAFIPERLDSDVVAAAFKVEATQAARALQLAATEPYKWLHTGKHALEE
jgi:hypothetical protein